MPLTASILISFVVSADPEIVAHEVSSFVGYAITDGEKAYSAGATWCNLGDANAAWEFGTNQHPISALNLVRIENGALRHLGASWATHQFCALQGAVCAECIPAGAGCPPALGVGCSTNSTGTSLGLQSNMSRRSDANAATGYFSFPFSNPPSTSLLDRRCRTAVADVDPAAHPNALFAFELVTLHPSAGDPVARCVTRKVTTASMLGTPLASGPSEEGSTAIEWWASVVPGVTLVALDLPRDGRVIVGGNAFALPGGGWRYDYAIENVDSHEAIRALSIPRGNDVDFQSIEFHAPLAHSGEVTSNEPWNAIVSSDALTWSTPAFDVDPNANAVRWGTTYTFSLISARPPVTGTVTLTHFRSNATEVVSLPVPEGLASGVIGDLDGDGAVSATDLSILLGAWGPCRRCSADFDGDGHVDANDLAVLLGAWS
ncbi:MAG: hypothetical protein JNL80_15210 [Phycisphaerae bacterium]|nr:hypothetical protein [Phycisphaerae bacterium]